MRGIGDIPQLDRAAVVDAGQHVPLGAEHYRQGDGGTASRPKQTWAIEKGLAERAGVRGTGDVPQPDCAIRIAAGQHVPVRAERHRVNEPGARRQGCGQGRVLGVQQAGGEVFGGLDAVGGEGELGRERCVAGAELEGLSDYLVVDGLVTLPHRGRPLGERDDRCCHRQCGQQGEDHETVPPPPGAAARGVVSGAEERRVARQRRVAGGGAPASGQRQRRWWPAGPAGTGRRGPGGCSPRCARR